MSDRSAVGLRRWAKASAPAANPRAELRRELRRWSLCKGFVYQFSLIAKREPPKQRTGGHRGGGKGGRRPHIRRIKAVRGLAAVKHAQQSAERGSLMKRSAFAEASADRQEKAFGALAAVQTAARAEWPEAMKRELQSCRTPEQQRLWSEKWALQLAGRVMSDVAPERPSGGGRIAGGGRQPS